MLGNLVRETSNAPGTGTTVTLNGATAGRRTFLDEFGAGAQCFYFITDGTQTEAQIGTVAAGPPATLTRGTPVWTSAAGAASPTRLNFTGTVTVYSALPGQRAVYTDSAGDLKGITAAKLRDAAGATTVGAALLTAADAAVARAAIAAVNSAGDTITGGLQVNDGLVVGGAGGASVISGLSVGTSMAVGTTLDVGGNATISGAAGVVAVNAPVAWVSFAGSTGAIRSGFNVSSVTRNAAGQYRVNYTTALANANYAFVGSARNVDAGTSGGIIVSAQSGGAYSTSALDIEVTRDRWDGVLTLLVDADIVNVVIFATT